MADDEEHPADESRVSEGSSRGRPVQNETATTPPDTSATRSTRPTAAGIRRALPEYIGHYRILRVIGEGGMGTVYEAEQENPKRHVALKVIRAGATSARLLHRFEHEAQILGKLQHPGIAQVFEAGTFETALGEQPFFAMEYVRGTTLGDHVRQKRPTVRERLELVGKTCAAVHHAHQKGVIHRDLKPGNILVDQSGQPKILDFGIARVTDSDIQLTTMQTDVGQLIGTIQYMSPEQAAADPDELDTRSDVYALGAILYELLAERPPYDLSKKSIHEAVRVIREQEPASLSSVSKIFRGDVETIVAKALEKDKSRRYESAEQFAADIRRFLREEPIVARPPSTLYQLRKFAKRNRALVTGVVVAFVALSAGLVVSLGQFLRAESERSFAEEARDESDAVTNFLEGMLASVDPRELGREVTVREVLDKSAQTIEREFADRPLIESRLRHTIGSTYSALGVYEAAEPHLERAAEIRRRVLGEDQPETLESLSDLAWLYAKQGRYDEAEQMFVKILETYRRAVGEDHQKTVRAMAYLGTVYQLQTRYHDAERLLTAALEVQRRVDGGRSTENLADRMQTLAGLYTLLGRLDEAESLYVEALETYQGNSEERGLRTPDAVEAMGNLGVLYRKQGREDDAERLFLEAVATSRDLLGEEHPWTLDHMTNLATVYANQGRYDEAEALYLEILETQGRVLGEDHPSAIGLMVKLGALYAGQGPLHFEEAESLLASAVERADRTLPDGHVLVGISLLYYGRLLREIQRHADAEKALLRAHEVFVGSLGAEDVYGWRYQAARDLALLYETWGQPDAAAEWRDRIPAEYRE